jgi:hypothetical protein
MCGIRIRATRMAKLFTSAKTLQNLSQRFFFERAQASGKHCAFNFKKRIRMISFVSPVTIPTIPDGISNPKRLAKALHGYFPMKKLSDCQATVAHLFGHKDWHALEVASQANAASGPFNFDLTNELAHTRYLQQHQIIAKELANLSVEKEQIKIPSHRGGQPEERMKNASERWAWQYSREVLVELAPTRKSSPPPPQSYDIFSAYSINELEKLPAQLGAWWKKKIPYQPEVGVAIETFKLNPHSRTSLLNFSHYWGILSMYYAEVIDPCLMLGVAYILADRYGAIYAESCKEFTDWLDEIALNGTADLSEIDIPIAVHKAAITNLITASNSFFYGYPRDDFYIIFQNQREAFESHAKDAVRLLKL